MNRQHIVAAIIFSRDKKEIYITQRHKDTHKGGYWEFPGGKVETNETAEQAIKRELIEEVGIEITEWAHFEHLNYDYTEKSLTFDFFTITAFKNTPYGKEGQRGEWVSIQSLHDYSFPEANLSVLEKVIRLYR